MATYTVELREVCEMETDIGLNNYPIFDEEYRECLNQKIKDHFWNREIGQETIGMFKLQLRRRMNEIMPYWNQQYKASQIEFDPLKTVSVKTVSGTSGNATVTGTGETTSQSDAKARAVSSVHPQSALSGNGDYADSSQDNISGTTAAGTSAETQTTANTGTVDSETSGYQGSAAILIAEYRATLVNTDMDVIAQLENLFMGIWDSSDDYSQNGALPNYGYFGYLGYSF